MGILIHATDATGTWSVIEAEFFHLLGPNAGRSRTRDTPGDALKATWEPTLNTPVGAGSIHKFIKVRTIDLPGFNNPHKLPGPLNPRNYGGGKVIPDYPQKCAVCGGGVLILFSSVEHEGGSCPGPKQHSFSFSKRNYGRP